MDSTPSRADRYVEASRSYAGLGDGRLAVLAMCAADTEILQQLLWEHGLDQAPDPPAQLAAVGEAVLGSMADTAGDTPGETQGGITAPRAVEQFRASMIATFDESVHDLLADRFAPLDHLRGLRVSAAEAAEVGRERLAGRTAAQLTADLLHTAGDCAAVAEVMLAEGDGSGALRQLWQADLAAFEAYLLSTAVRAGDNELATVELRWELARGLGLAAPQDAEVQDSGVQDSGVQDSEAVEDTVAAWRRAFTDVVSTAEAAALQSYFVPVPVA
jgi:hypothetical protein